LVNVWACASVKHGGQRFDAVDDARTGPREKDRIGDKHRQTAKSRRRIGTGGGGR